jgi:hypothetical protein
MEKVTIIGVDLAKSVFQLHGAAADGSVVFRKKLTRPQFRKFMAAQRRRGQSRRWLELHHRKRHGDCHKACQNLPATCGGWLDRDRRVHPPNHGSRGLKRSINANNQHIMRTGGRT